MDQMQQNVPRSAMAIAGLVLGIIAALSSLIPIINNLSFVLAALGVIFSIVGLAGCVRGSRIGKGMAIAALVLNIVAIILVFVSQGAYSAAIDDAVNGAEVESVATADDSSADASSTDDAASAEQTSENLAVGTAVTLDNGMTVTVDSVQTGLTNYDGSTVTGVHVTYTNSGSDSVDFNPYDWKGQDANGAQRDTTYYSSASEELSYGSLAAGGSVSGNIYFDGDISSVLYFGSVLSDTARASWALA